jgi:hypothetical protein
MYGNLDTGLPTHSPVFSYGPGYGLARHRPLYMDSPIYRPRYSPRCMPTG